MNREDWLIKVAEGMAPWFNELGYALPRYRIAIGFPSTGRRGKRIGECWVGGASADGTFEILIRPDLDVPLDVAVILARVRPRGRRAGVRAQGRVPHRRFGDRL